MKTTVILEDFVKEEKILVASKELLQADTDIKCHQIISQLSKGQLEKLSAFLNCQKKDISNSFALVAILITGLVTCIQTLEKLIIFTPIQTILIGVSVSIVIFAYREGNPIINKSNNKNKKIDYIIFLIDQEIKRR